MKDQTIGVEVEMNNISRKDAAQVAVNFFGGCSYCKPYDRRGTWVTYDNDHREWLFKKDASIHGIPSQKCELITPILHYNDIETLQELCRRLRQAGAKSNSRRGCGVHVHIGAKGHTPESLRNLVNIMASHEDLLKESLRLDKERIYEYCQPVDHWFLIQLNKKKPKTFSALADVWYDCLGDGYSRNDHYNNSRYHMLNLHSTFTKGTIEFRLFQFDPPERRLGKKNGIHAGQLKTYIQLCLALSNAAKENRSFRAISRYDDVTKDTMRQWLYRLGMVGDEFKTARYFLTKNLRNRLALVA